MEFATVITPGVDPARRVALVGMAVSAALACSNIIVGLLANSIV